MRELLRIRQEERWPALVALVLIAALQYLIISKFFGLFAVDSAESWRIFMRNFHMSGFDPITYNVLTDWGLHYDVLRHPLLPFFFYPFYLLNRLLLSLTGTNCAQLIVGLLLTFCAVYTLVFLYRIQREVIGIRRSWALLLTAFFFGFAYIVVAMIVPDHFCFSLFLLMATLYLAGRKIRRHEKMTTRETILLFMLTAGVTLSNGAVVLLAAIFVNGRDFFRPRYLLLAAIAPCLLLFSFAMALKMGTSLKPSEVSNPVQEQLRWADQRPQRTSIIVENLFGESIQLHRQHILGDVLTGRPLIVRYTWKAQYLVEALIILLFAAGIACGRRDRYLWLLMAVFLFNMALHIGLAFAIDEVYIMAAHWIFVIPLSIAYLLRAIEQKENSLPAYPYHPAQEISLASLRYAVLSALLIITAYLWMYHGYLLYHYLTWPIAK